MGATPIGVDRPAEAEAVAGDMVEGRAGANLVEVDPHRLGRIEGADDGPVADTGEAHVVLDPLLVPPHANICSHIARAPSHCRNARCGLPRCWSRSLRA